MNPADENWRYYEGLNTFEFWTGPKPEINHPKYQVVMKRLQKAFHQYNITRIQLLYLVVVLKAVQTR